ncbi:unnamed protein product [Lupinus luteus]|uniref:Dof zinc finger protein n=1 Tax=Lupinus luteus TaxID=3873 RepID=A0AAV1XKN5_LUPLU
MEHEGNGERNMNNQQTHDVQIRQGGIRKQVKPQKPHEIQQCPRCDSLNTRFCYYNNYNLTQPRYFCKECRRYWTQGGTLRNIPIGGSCRKRKHAKNSSNSHAQQPQPQSLTLSPIMVSSINPSYEGLSSDFIGYSLPSQHQIQPSNFYQMGNTEREVSSLYMTQGLGIPTNMSNSNISDASLNDWPQNFTDNANTRTFDDAFFSSTSVGSSPLNLNQWSDIKGFGPLL